MGRILWKLGSFSECIYSGPPHFLALPTLRLPLFRFSRRARSTSWGIALCTMFIVASFSVAGGIRNSTAKLESSFSADYYLVTLPAEHGMGFFGLPDLSSSSAKSAFGVFALVAAEPSGQNITVFSIEDPNHVLTSSISTTGNDVLAGTNLALLGNLSLRSENVTIIGKFSSPMFSDDWLLGSPELLRSLTGQQGYNFAVSKSLTANDITNLESDGFSVEPMIGIIQFLRSGAGEIERDMSWVLIPSSFVTAILAYSFLGSETADRRHEIGILKTIGAGRRRVLTYLLANAAIVSAWGGALGLALGIVLSYGISTIASTMFASVFMIKASESLLLLSFGAAVLAGLAGGLGPAVRMTWSSPVEDLKEVGR